MELVDSVDELRSSSSTRGVSMPKFEVFDAKIASALNKIIHNSPFKRRVSLEEHKAQQDRFFRGRQIAFLIYEFFRVTGANDSVENCADLFTICHRNDCVQEFDSRWDGIPSSMTKISRDILEGLHKSRTRYSSEDNGTRPSQIEDHGKKKYPARCTKQEFSGPEMEIVKKRRGQESGNKTACTKNFWRFLAMGNQRAVF